MATAKVWKPNFIAYLLHPSEPLPQDDVGINPCSPSTTTQGIRVNCLVEEQDRRTHAGDVVTLFLHWVSQANEGVFSVWINY